MDFFKYFLLDLLDFDNNSDPGSINNTLKLLIFEIFKKKYENDKYIKFCNHSVIIKYDFFFYSTKFILNLKQPF